jgi:hypothetical protein
MASYTTSGAVIGGFVYALDVPLASLTSTASG